MKSGILIVDKPVDWTSHDVVAKLRGILRTKKIGHTGTLDPFATGVLVMLVGKATRLAKYLDKDVKSYEAIVRFGFETDTGDRTGERRRDGETGRKGGSVTVKEIDRVLPEFMGEIEQIPPMYSAKKVKGKKLYELARKGIEVERKPVEVTISELKVMGEAENRKRRVESEEKDLELKTQDYRFKVTCSAGTYIRTLAEDIGRKLEVPCHLADLRRTKAGKFGIKKTMTLEELEKTVEEERLDEILVSMNEAVGHLPEKSLNENELKRIQNGMKVGASFDVKGVQEVRLTDALENLVAIGIYDNQTQQIQPKLVFLN